jgi:GT2 family glycosyltransferase
MSIRVSVVVPTYKRPELLDRCLAALLEQKFEPTGYEVIVADDAASIHTESQVERWAGQAAEFGSGHTIRYVAVKGRHGPAAARNAGWRAARGEIIAFTDDDCVPHPQWLGMGVGAFEGDTVGAAGRIIVPVPPTPTDYERDVAGLECSEFATANCFYRRDALVEVGGFDERFTMAWREDSDLYLTLLERGHRLVKVPAAVVVHPVRPARWGISLCQQRKSVFNALLYRKHPALYWRKIQPHPPWHYYQMVGMMLLGLAALLTGRHRLATSAAGGWLWLVGRFCARRLRGTSLTPSHVAEMVVTSMLIPPVCIFWRVYGAVKYRVLFL